MLRNTVSLLVCNKTRLALPVICSLRFYPRKRRQNVGYNDDVNYFRKQQIDILTEADRFEYEDEMEEKSQTEVRRDKHAQQKWLKKKIIHAKVWNKEPEFNLLSWSAKEQIRHLHALDPHQWDVPSLARSFPLSEDSVKAVLKANYFKTEKQIKEHDRRVRQHWIEIKKYLNDEDYQQQVEGGPLEFTMRHIVTENKLHLMLNAGGLLNVKLPPPQSQCKEKGKKPIGMFQSIVKDYVEEKNSRSEKQNNMTNALTAADAENIFKELSGGTEIKSNPGLLPQESSLPDFPVNKLCKRRREKAHLLNQDIGGSNIEELGVVEAGPELSVNTADHWVSPVSSMTGNIVGEAINTSKPVNYYEGVRKQKLSVLSKIKYESSSNNDDNEAAYIFDYAKGYNYPLGKTDDSLKKLEIPAAMRRKNVLYQKDNYVFDEDGEFLYKTP